ncbi:hypothetical protein Pint_29242 [Pistacia integerrima]|uniref:Uncharacterized protein n=1 Tax=Pistacia integerrima TaxID=434235 RepID=A0ACC0X1L6_9ROSI|nr:hypothetical protein Pint_29242 [Pistacia integerrima]
MSLNNISYSSELCELLHWLQIVIQKMLLFLIERQVQQVMNLLKNYYRAWLTAVPVPHCFRPPQSLAHNTMFCSQIDLPGMLSNGWNFEICATEQNDYFEAFKHGPIRKQEEDVLITCYSTFAVSCAPHLIIPSAYSDANYSSLGNRDCWEEIKPNGYSWKREALRKEVKAITWLFPRISLA